MKNKKNLERIEEITVPTSPDYFLDLIISRHLQNLAIEIGQMNPESQHIFKRYLQGIDFKELKAWGQYQHSLAKTFQAVQKQNELNKNKK